MTTEEALKGVIEVGKELAELLEQLKKTDDKLVGLFDQYAKTASDATQKDMVARLTSWHATIKKLLDKPSEQARIAEYNSLSSFINSRSAMQMTLNSFLVTGAAVALTFAVGTSSTAGVGGWVALLPALLIVLAWTNLVGLNYLDKKTYNRIRDIETELGISGGPNDLFGHTGIYRQVQNSPLYKARDSVWHFFYFVIFAASVVTAVHLFCPGFL